MGSIDFLGALIMWLIVLIGWLIKGCKTNLFKGYAKIGDSAKRNAGIAFMLIFLAPISLALCQGN